MTKPTILPQFHTPADPFVEKKSVHFVGVGGIGLSRLAKMFLIRGKKVSGSDIVKNDTVSELEALGLSFYLGHKAESLPADCDLLIYSIAIQQDNPERVLAAERKLLQMSHFDALGKLAAEYTTIAVAGTNGKSTVTTMIGLILEAAGWDPTVFVGSKVPVWQGNLRMGKNNYLVIEADELNRQFLSIRPFAAIVTNIEPDHLDYYRDINDIRSAFIEFLKPVAEIGFISYNADDVVCSGIAEFLRHPKKISFGHASGWVRYTGSKVIGRKQIFEVVIDNKPYIFELLVPGEINVYNALAAISCAHALEIPIPVIKQALEKFTGIWRRFENVGSFGRAVVISDYAHHPTSIRATIEAAKSFYPDKKILVVYQPHQKRRTKELFTDLVTSLVDERPETLIISEIYDVAGREKTESEDISSLDLVEAVSRKIEDTRYGGGLEKTESLIRSIGQNYDLILIMGAGNIHDVALRLVAPAK